MEVTPVPQSAVPENDVVIPASQPVRLQIPSIDFDSSKLKEWTKAMNDASDGEVTPPDSTTLVWDSTVAGGGLFGTDAQSSGRILAHTTPRDWSQLGAFTNLNLVHVGDPVALTTQKGKLCYGVTRIDDKTPKPQLNVVYSKDAVVKGVIYLITCSRTADNPHGPTKENLVLTLQLNQQQTNTGSC